MEITTFRFVTTGDVVIGALPQSVQGAPLAVRERSIAHAAAPFTGDVRPLPAVISVADRMTVRPNADGGARVRTWRPPD